MVSFYFWYDISDILLQYLKNPFYKLLGCHTKKKNVLKNTEEKV